MFDHVLVTLASVAVVFVMLYTAAQQTQKHSWSLGVGLFVVFFVISGAFIWVAKSRNVEEARLLPKGSGESDDQPRRSSSALPMSSAHEDVSSHPVIQILRDTPLFAAATDVNPPVADLNAGERAVVITDNMSSTFLKVETASSRVQGYVRRADTRRVDQ